MTDFKNKTCAVVGLGISNTPLIDFLLQQGAQITARDKKEFDLLPDAVKAYREKGVSFRCGEGYLEELTEDVIFRSPGLRYDLPAFQTAVSRGAVLTSEMQVFFELCPCPILGVTGSDGKTTTTTLIHHALAAQYGEDHVFLGGNIGAPLLPRLPLMKPDCFAVVELSSFQLHTMTRSPDRAVITNLSPNHLDYHRGMEEYVDAKKNIYRHQKPGSLLVLNGRQELSAELVKELAPGCRVTTFAGRQGGKSVYEKEGAVYRGNEKVLSVSDIKLPGHHNVENYMAAIAMLDGLVRDEVIVDLAKTFGGVEHRLELIRVKDGVRYFNSSIDSSPSRTAAALSSFTEKVIVICGGYDKKIPFAPLAESLCEHASTVVLTGATADAIEKALLSHPAYREGAPRILRESRFDDAVKAASDAAKPGDTVILSPACASFDAFKNFEERGNRFRALVQGL